MCPVEVELQSAAGIRSGAGLRAVLMVPKNILSAYCMMPPCDGTGKLPWGNVMWPCELGALSGFSPSYCCWSLCQGVLIISFSLKMFFFLNGKEAKFYRET